METKIIVSATPASTRSDGWAPPGSVKVSVAGNSIRGGCSDSISGMMGGMPSGAQWLGNDVRAEGGYTSGHVPNGTVRIEVSGGCTLFVQANPLAGSDYANGSIMGINPYTFICGGNSELSTCSW
jgi:hypothetical protein